MQIARIRNLITIGLLSLIVSGCGDTSDLGKLKEGFTEKPDNYEDMMKAANRFANTDPAKAMVWYRNAMQTAESEYGPNDGRVANAAMYDAAIARSTNKLGEAEEMYKRAYEIQLKISGPNSAGIKDVQKLYAETLVANFKLDEARKIDPHVKTPADSLKSSRPRGKGKH